MTNEDSSIANGTAERGGSGAAQSKKPKDSAFKQQRLPAWQPILTAGTVLPTFIIIGIAFIPIGCGMFYFSETVREYKIDYTNCSDSSSQDKTPCADQIAQGLNSSNSNCKCLLEFSIDEDWEGEVFMYYALTNFYQNHRRYVKSRDDSQLLGSINPDGPSTDCDPFSKNSEGKTYFPCGAIANSLFSDVITMKYTNTTNGGNTEIPVNLKRTGIAWESDRKYKFSNPDTGDLTLEEYMNKYNLVSPKDWVVPLWELDATDSENNGVQNEDLIVWMRTAALPNFRKLYRKIDHEQEQFKNGLPKGNYILEINYRFRVTPFSGTKSIVLSTTSVLGGKNPFLGIAYITVGAICLILGIVFLFIHMKCGKQTSELMNISSRSSYN